MLALIDRPDWALPPGVDAAQTGRRGGASRGCWSAFNLGDHVGDDVHAVRANRRTLATALPGVGVGWLRQVHSARVVELRNGPAAGEEADAVVTRVPGIACAVLTADCLPVLLADHSGQVVAAAHAGWRGLVGGVLAATVAAMAVPPAGLTAWLGPAICARHYEVGDEVRAAAGDPAGFVPVAGRPGHWWMDLAGMARRQLAALGVQAIAGGDACTEHTRDGDGAPRYFSDRRERPCGRQATLVWISVS